MECMSCGKPKNQVHAVKSAIIKGVTVFLCQTCIDNGFEPRWTIVMAGRQQGIDRVQPYIVKRKYHGPEVTAAELL